MPWALRTTGILTRIARTPSLLTIENEGFSTTESQCLVPHFRGDVRVAVARGHCCLRHSARLQLRGLRRSLRSRCQSDSRARRRIPAREGALARRRTSPRRRGPPARHSFPPRRRSAARSLRQERLRRQALLFDHPGVRANATGLRYPESDFTTGARHFPLVRGA